MGKKNKFTVFTPRAAAFRLKGALAFSNLALPTINYYNFKERYLFEEKSSKDETIQKRALR